MKKLLFVSLLSTAALATGPVGVSRSSYLCFVGDSMADNVVREVNLKETHGCFGTTYYMSFVTNGQKSNDVGCEYKMSDDNMTTLSCDGTTVMINPKRTNGSVMMSMPESTTETLPMMCRGMKHLKMHSMQ